MKPETHKSYLNLRTLSGQHNQTNDPPANRLAWIPARRPGTCTPQDWMKKTLDLDGHGSK
jgi:hypothetical protein